MKNTGILLILSIFFFPACRAFKPLSPATGPAELPSVHAPDRNHPKKTTRSDKKVPDPSNVPTPDINYMLGSIGVENSALLQFRYAILLDVEVEKISNRPLYEFIESWWGTPYRMGGTTQRGVDCSSFVQQLMSRVYDQVLPRTAREQRQSSSSISNDDLQEGDLVFFNTRGGTSHVGIYLHNNKFVHASTSSGVTISDLNESYWRARYLGAGRMQGVARN